MQLSPLQSRLVASLVASIFILALYWLLCFPNFALAAEPPLRSYLDLESSVDLDQSLEQNGPLQLLYEPEFGLFDRSIIGRQEEAGPRDIGKDQPVRWTMEPGGSACYKLDIIDTDQYGADLEEKDEEEGGEEEEENEKERTRRQTGKSKTVYISATTCVQPYLTNPDAQSRVPLPLRLVASTSSDGCPTSVDKTGSSDGGQDFEEGLVEVELPVGNSPVYVSIIAPEKSEDFEGKYDFELVMSLNTSYHHFDTLSKTVPRLLLMDSDSTAALLHTQKLTDRKSDTQRIMDMGPPYELFVENSRFPVFDGIRRSLCGMEQTALISANKNNDGRGSGLVNTSISTGGPENLPKQQFYFEGLNKTSNYTAVLVQVAGLNGNAADIDKRQDETSNLRRSVVSAPVNFQTLTGTTCKVITDLAFCTETQWAVPSGNDFDTNELAKFYDNYARDMYSNFEKIMMQIPCETWTTSKYTLARNCDDCKKAYKRWLCTVAMPRCEDYSSTNGYRIERNVGQPFPNGTMVPESDREKLSKYRRYNESRNSFIDDKVAPGPYKEILPCEELCYEVVQSCPASLGFTCPLPGMSTFNSSYGRRIQTSTTLTCNYPGEPRTRISDAGTVVPPMLLLSLAPLGVLAAML